MDIQLYICPESYRCKNNNNGLCTHAKPHAYESLCNGVCSPDGPHGDTIIDVNCVPIQPDFIKEGEFKI